MLSDHNGMKLQIRKNNMQKNPNTWKLRSRVLNDKKPKKSQKILGNILN